ncbi:MAG: Tetrahedral aminopeptidase [Candidatus Methanofastidiosum methylothiophilum]|uniref:Tetrahedral aminopeptidase n=1 Tax=Candidatus Methanofastidiosum methylothiophilum TaxID=1705564 RepID=A0A150ILI7_9EURY|nr:MAG: Tetrahedral aminopeptidase [Candidatus Methanofastidiosum methylthiophilus]KYC48015.1 MAG: Tetrahedral aminopeptidase [Candidatus Methanofastidiosum methylthiophilus]KYC50705.1 MAG: Tetrahedral aminopeptidase [Candidatus Methanofastidiosum methylthiophilus]
MMEDLLKKLSEAPGVSGHENRIKKLIIEEIKNDVDEIKEDSMGNLITTKRGSSEKFKVMIATHMDEIGFMVKHIDDKGFISFETIGGFDPRTLGSQRVKIHSTKRDYIGVIGIKPPHITPQEEKDKALKVEDLRIDLGLTTKEEVEKLGIKPGDPITRDISFTKLGKDNIVSCKSFDNRAGCTILIEILKKINNPDYTLYGVFTTQEEVGLRGAKTASYGLDIDFAIIIDSTVGGPIPKTEADKVTISLGKGPSIDLMDRGFILSERVKEILLKAANESSIPYQTHISSGSTDGAVVHTTKEGIPTAVISIPSKYIHSTVEILDLNDLESTLKLAIKSIEIAKDIL